MVSADGKKPPVVDFLCQISSSFFLLVVKTFCFSNSLDFSVQFRFKSQTRSGGAVLASFLLLEQLTHGLMGAAVKLTELFLSLSGVCVERGAQESRVQQHHSKVSEPTPPPALHCFPSEKLTSPSVLSQTVLQNILTGSEQ